MALTKLQSFNIDSTANFTFANITTTNANLGNAATANYFIGNGSLLTGIANSNYANYAGTIVNSSQPNITSVGTLANLTSNGTINFTTSTNVSLGAVANLHISGGTSGYVLQTDGAGTLTWAPQASYAPTYISNGTSNVTIATLNGNIAMSVGGISNVLLATTTGIVVKGNIDAGANYVKGNGYYLTDIDAGTANIANSIVVGNSAVKAVANGNVFVNVAGTSNTVVFTSTGVNIAGYANVTGNVSAPYFVGNGYYLSGVDTAGKLSNGSSNISIPSTNGNITMGVGGNANVVKVTDIGVNVAGYVNATGNINATYFVGNGAFLTGVDTSPSNISSGTSNVQVISAGGNVTTSVNGNANIVTVTGTGMNVSGYITSTGNIDAGSSYIKGNGYYLSGVSTAGSLVNGNSNVNIPAANSDITMSVAGNANVFKVTGVGVNVAGNVNATYFVGNGAFLTGVDTSPANISNGNSNVQVLSNSNVTVSVAGNSNIVTVTGVGVNVSGNISATYFVGNGSLLTGVDVTPSSMSNGNSNVSISTAGGNVTVSVFGTANVMKVTSTGANITGYANITGNVSAPYFIGNGAFLTGVDTSPANITNGNSNVQVTANSNVTIGVSGNAGVVVVTGTGANVDGYVTANGNVTGSYIKGNGYYLTGLSVSTSNISNGSSNVDVSTTNGNITMGVSGNANVVTVTGTGINVAGYITVTGQLTSTATTGTAPFVISSTTQVANLNAATAGTVTTNAQSNITSVGTLTSLTVGPNSNVILSGTSGFVRANSVQGTDGTAGLYMYYGAAAGAVGVRTDLTVGAGGSGNLIANVGTVTLGDLGNVKVAGGASGYVIQTDGAGNLSWVSPTGGGFGGGANIGNGSANVRTFLNGNVTISSNGNANVVNVTGTGVIVTGNVDAGANYVKGNGFYLTGVDTAGKVVNGTSNLSIVTSSGNVTVGVAGNANIMTVTGTGVNVAGYANVTGNVSAPFFVGNGFYLTGVDTAGKVTNGTSNLSITTAGGNVTTSVNGNANVMVVTGTGANVAGYVNATGNVSGSNITASGQFISVLAQGTAPLQVISTTQVANLNAAVAGTVTTNAQPNITSVGNLTGLTVSNVTGVVDFTTSANVTLGYVGNLHITGGSANYVLKTDGAGNLSWTAQSGGGGGGGGTSITNGTSNVDIATVSGNVTVTSNGNTTMTVTDTGANISGYANITGNVALSGANISLGNIGNLHIAGGSNNYVLKTNGAGNLAWVAQSGGGSGIGAIEEFVATAGQDTFTILGGYNAGSAIVFVNGIQMNNNDYTADDGTTVVLTEPRLDGDVVRVLSSMVSPAININSLKAYSIAISIAMGI